MVKSIYIKRIANREELRNIQKIINTEYPKIITENGNWTFGLILVRKIGGKFSNLTLNSQAQSEYINLRVIDQIKKYKCN